MQALTYSRFGSADCLQLTELDAPHPRAGQVLVQVAAAGLNPIDVKTRAGKGFVAQQLGHRFRFVSGYDLAGTLLQGSDRLPAGAAVIGMVGDGVKELVDSSDDEELKEEVRRERAR